MAIEQTDEMRAAVRRRMGVPDGVELDPWMDAAIGDVLAIVERDYDVRPRETSKGWLIEHVDHHRNDAPVAECPFCAPTGHACESPAECWGDPDCPLYSSHRAGRAP